MDQIIHSLPFFFKQIPIDGRKCLPCLIQIGCVVSLLCLHEFFIGAYRIWLSGILFQFFVEVFHLLFQAADIGCTVGQLFIGIDQRCRRILRSPLANGRDDQKETDQKSYDQSYQNIDHTGSGAVDHIPEGIARHNDGIIAILKRNQIILLTLLFVLVEFF